MKQKLSGSRNRDQQCTVRIKFGNLLKQKNWFCVHHSNLVPKGPLSSLGKTGWSTVVVNGTHQIPFGNFKWDALFPFPQLFPGR